MKQHGGDQLARAVRHVLAGEIYLNESLASTARTAGKNAPTSLASQLTDRELEVLNWIGNGCDNAETARRLHLSIKTVDAQREHMKKKLRLKTSTELNLFAVRWVEADRVANQTGVDPRGRKERAEGEARKGKQVRCL